MFPLQIQKKKDMDIEQRENSDCITHNKMLDVKNAEY